MALVAPESPSEQARRVFQTFDPEGRSTRRSFSAAAFYHDARVTAIPSSLRAGSERSGAPPILTAGQHILRAHDVIVFYAFRLCVCWLQVATVEVGSLGTLSGLAGPLGPTRLRRRVRRADLSGFERGQECRPRTDADVARAVCRRRVGR